MTKWECSTDLHMDAFGESRNSSGAEAEGVWYGVGGRMCHTSGCWDLYVLSALCVAGHREILDIFKQDTLTSTKPQEWILANLG